MTKVPFLNLTAQHRALKSELMEQMEACLDSGTFILGKSVEDFEMKWAAYCQSTWALGVSNGLDALVLALKACEIGPGCEVIVPAQTFIATWLAVSLVGATPVAVDVERDTANIDPLLVEKAITSATRAVIAVDLFGQLANMKALREICDKHKLYLIEDAAQAHGASLDGDKAGKWSELTTYSFYPGKNLGALGDAGAITGKSLELKEKLFELRNYGSRVKYIHNTQGCNARLDPLQARFLEVKVRYLNEWNQQRKEQAQFYLDQLQNVRGLTLPVVSNGSNPSWHLFVVKTPLRDHLQGFLKEEGIETLIHYPIPPYLQRAYLGYNHLHFPCAYEWAVYGLSLPLGPHLDEESQLYISEKIRQFFTRV